MSELRFQFWQSANELCKSQSDTHLFDRKIRKSYAQVAGSVEQRAVRQKPSGLKPEGNKPSRLAVRLSEEERAVVVRKSTEANLTISDYIRASVLGPGYVSNIDPQKRQILITISRELARQGLNLNQIAKRLNAGFHPKSEIPALAILAKSLLVTHRTLWDALNEGRSMD